MLNVAHPVGGPKASWLIPLGFATDEPEVLAICPISLARDSDIFTVKESDFGVKCIVDGVIHVPSGVLVDLRTVRIVETGMKEHDAVVLTRDLGEHGLTAGDVGAMVPKYDRGAAYEVEFVSGDGTTTAVVTLQDQDIRQVAASEILHVRSVAA